MEELEMRAGIWWNVSNNLKLLGVLYSKGKATSKEMIKANLNDSITMFL